MFNGLKMIKISKYPERCWFNAMFFRSLGIPCTIDFDPAWYNRNSSHEWNAVRFNRKTYPFESIGGRGKWKPKQVCNNEWMDEYWKKSRLSKVFRYTYKINQEELSIEDSPPLFKQQNYVYVSPEYFKTANVIVESGFVKRCFYIYLCVY